MEEDQVLVEYWLNERGKNPIEDFILKLEPKARAKVIQMLGMIRTYGLMDMRQHIRKLGGIDMWEIRILGADNVRLFYHYVHNAHIIVLHGFVKKKQKTPKKEVEVACNRMRIYKNALDK